MFLFFYISKTIAFVLVTILLDFPFVEFQIILLGKNKTFTPNLHLDF